VSFRVGKTAKAKLEIRLTFERGSRVPHPQTGEPMVAYDTTERRWRHMNFFQYECEIMAKVPRVGRGGAEGRLLRHFRAIIFLLAGNLQFSLPDPFQSPLLNPQ